MVAHRNANLEDQVLTGGFVGPADIIPAQAGLRAGPARGSSRGMMAPGNCTTATRQGLAGGHRRGRVAPGGVAPPNSRR